MVPNVFLPTNHVNFDFKKSWSFQSDSIVPNYKGNEAVISMTCSGGETPAKWGPERT